MDTNVLAASKDPKDLQQTPAQSRTAYLDANVHAASMDTKDLKQTQYRKLAIDANQLSCMDPTTHTKNPGHSKYTYIILTLASFIGFLTLTPFPEFKSPLKS
ncbi:uncharacterized protein LOC125847365 [Solanum stenotomum]|uniref:uncharacterized protein LOC125847365 n=1 Tax=Solanum stenotomum TaxID=172797 RepID=UPI0020D18576|nr:uncharacterized protein LOC125847365 [Solanum stenotomum]